MWHCSTWPDLMAWIMFSAAWVCALCNIRAWLSVCVRMCMCFLYVCVCVCMCVRACVCELYLLARMCGCGTNPCNLLNDWHPPPWLRVGHGAWWKRDLRSILSFISALLLWESLHFPQNATGDVYNLGPPQTPDEFLVEGNETGKDNPLTKLTTTACAVEMMGQSARVSERVSKCLSEWVEQL